MRRTKEESEATRLAIVAAGAAPRDRWRTTLPNGSITVFDVIGDEIQVVRVPQPIAVATSSG